MLGYIPSDSDSDDKNNHIENRTQAFVSPKPALSFDVSKFYRELKHVKIKSESYSSISSFYTNLQSAIGVATKNPHTLPDIEILTPHYCFDKYIMPPKSSAMYIHGKASYLSISRALKKKLMHLAMASADCTKLINKRNTHSHINGFCLLLKMLSTILPNLGGQSLNVVDEIANIKLEDGKNLNSLYLKFTTLNVRTHDSSNSNDSKISKYIDEHQANADSCGNYPERFQRSFTTEWSGCHFSSVY